MVLAVLFDVTGAFDNIRWRTVQNELKTRDCKEDISELISSYLKDREVIIEEKYEKVSKRIYKSCPQGSILGPDLSNIVVDRLLNLVAGLGGEMVAYADDLILLIKGNSRRQLEEKTQYFTDIISKWCVAQGLQLSKTKTEMIYMKDAGQGRKAGKLKGTKGFKKLCTTGSVQGSLLRTGRGGTRPPTVKVDNVTLKCVTCVKYLGVSIGMRMSFTEHVKGVAAKGKRMFSAMSAVARSNWGLSFECLRTIYKSVFIPTIMYAIGAWGDCITKSHDRVLLTAQKHALMRVSRAYRTVSVEALQVICGEVPLDVLAKEMYYKYKVRKKEAFTYEAFTFDPEMKPDRAKQQLKKISMRLWQERWDESPKGRTTYEYFPNVSKRMKLRKLEVNHYVTQFLTGHENFKQKLRTFNLVENETCECGGQESSKHILEDCCLYNKQRAELKNESIRQGRGWPVLPEELTLDEKMYKRETMLVEGLLAWK